LNLDKTLIILLIFGCPSVFIIGLVVLVVTLVSRGRRAAASPAHAAAANAPDPAQVVEVAHVVASGLALRYSAGRFVLDGVGQLSPADVRQRDAGGDLVWMSPETRDWFQRSFPA
jgi:hypothetical protein